MRATNVATLMMEKVGFNPERIAISGYADGKGVKPTYREITKPKNRFNPNNHAEVVLVVFVLALQALII